MRNPWSDSSTVPHAVRGSHNIHLEAVRGGLLRSLPVPSPAIAASQGYITSATESGEILPRLVRYQHDAEAVGLHPGSLFLGEQRIRDVGVVALKDGVVTHARHDTPYRASLADQISDAAGCAFSMAGILLAAVVTWLVIFALFALVTQ